MTPGFSHKTSRYATGGALIYTNTHRITTPRSGLVQQMKIIQYLPFWAAEKALSSASTFRLNSIRYYIELEEGEDGVGDSMEMKAIFDEGGSGEWGSSALISSWSIAEDQDAPTPSWSMMGERDVAILSTTDSVSSYIDDHVSDVLNKSWFSSHDKVNYYSSFKREDFKTRDIVFWKRKQYEDQREYRFSLRRSCIGAHLETLIFRNKLLDTFPSYIDQVFINPTLPNDEYKKLLRPWFCQKNPMSKFPGWEKAYEAQPNASGNG